MVLSTVPSYPTSKTASKTAVKVSTETNSNSKIFNVTTSSIRNFVIEGAASLRRLQGTPPLQTYLVYKSMATIYV